MPGMRPVLKLSYALNHASGFGVAGFHFVNILIHAGNGLLILYLMQRSGDTDRSPGQAGWRLRSP